MSIHLTEDTRLTLPRELVVGRLVMIAFLAVVWERQLAVMASLGSQERLALAAALVLLTGGWVWFWFWLAAAPEGWRQVVAVTVVVVAAGVMVSVNPEGVLPFYYGVVIAGAAFNWRVGVVLVPTVVALTVAAWSAFGASGQVLEVAGITLLFGTAAVTVRRVVAAQLALNQAESELRRLAGTKARADLARDLHDQLGQQLTVGILQAELLSMDLADSPSPVRERAAAVVASSRAALDLMRDAVSQPPRPGLATEITTGADRLEEAGIDCEVTVTTDVSASTSQTLGWVVREAVTNVLRHSGASRCTIRVERDLSEVVLRVQDDGQGSAGDRSGNGLANMRNRVSERGGSLQSMSEPGSGFAVVARVPVSEGGAL